LRRRSAAVDINFYPTDDAARSNSRPDLASFVVGANYRVDFGSVATI